jgi:hypothetical protein
MQLGQLLTQSCLTYPEVSSKFCHDSFCQLGNSVLLPWVIYYEAFCLHFVSCFISIPVNCLKLVLFLILLQFVYLFCNLSECMKGQILPLNRYGFVYFEIHTAYSERKQIVRLSVMLLKM